MEPSRIITVTERKLGEILGSHGDFARRNVADTERRFGGAYCLHHQGDTENIGSEALDLSPDDRFGEANNFSL